MQTRFVLLALILLPSIVLKQWMPSHVLAQSLLSKSPRYAGEARWESAFLSEW